GPPRTYPCPRMLRKLRHKFDMIRYYSAPRRQTPWSRARDIAFFVAFFLCLPATWIANVAVIRPTTAIAVSGWMGERIGANGEKSIDAAMTSNARSFVDSPNLKVVG